MRDVENDLTAGDFHEPKVKGVRMGAFKYANDQALLSKPQEGQENVIYAVKKHSEEKGLYMNVKKMKIKNNGTCKVPTDIIVGGEAIELVDSFEYLCALIDNKANTSNIQN